MATDATQEENARQLIKTTLEKIQAFNDTLNALRDKFRNTELLRELTERDQEILNMPLDKLGFEGMARRLVLEKALSLLTKQPLMPLKVFLSMSHKMSRTSKKPLRILGSPLNQD